MRQLSFAFLQASRNIARDASALGLGAENLSDGGVVLRRTDPTKNMARFYALEVERDLFGRVVLQALGKDWRHRQDAA
jgi:hypothetical protein